jgi:hypothetical protein
MSATVKVMRSYDYCHFEVQLGIDEAVTMDQVNELRKQAAILVDEAVRQYRIAKGKEQSRISKQYDRDRATQRIAILKDKPPEELNAEEAAILRADADGSFWKDFEDDDYIYSEDAERDHHFSMLNAFKRATVRA